MNDYYSKEADHHMPFLSRNQMLHNVREQASRTQLNKISSEALIERIKPQRIGNLAISNSQGMDLVQRVGNIDSLYVDEDEAPEYSLPYSNSLLFDHRQLGKSQ